MNLDLQRKEENNRIYREKTLFQINDTKMLPLNYKKINSSLWWDTLL